MRRITAIILLVLGTAAIFVGLYELYLFWMARETFPTLEALFRPEHQTLLLMTFGPPVLGFFFGVWAYRGSALGLWARIVWIFNLLVILGGVSVALIATQPLG